MQSALRGVSAYAVIYLHHRSHRALPEAGDCSYGEHAIRSCKQKLIRFVPVGFTIVKAQPKFEPGTVQLLAELHAGGTRVALLSNAGFDFSDPFRHSPMAAYFEAMFVSAELGLIKPDPEIYRVVARELGITLEQMVFIDNKKINVDAAVALGVTGHVFTTVAELRAFLESLAS